MTWEISARDTADQKKDPKLFPQNKHREADSSSSSTTQLWAEGGSHEGELSGLRQDNGRKALRLHPTHVLSFGAARMKDVTEHRPASLDGSARRYGTSQQEELTPSVPAGTGRFAITVEVYKEATGGALLFHRFFSVSVLAERWNIGGSCIQECFGVGTEVGWRAGKR